MKSFTLIELIIVIAIIAILAGAMVPIFRTSTYNSKISRVIADLEALKTGIRLLRADLGVYPRDGEWWTDPGLVNISQVPASYQNQWKGPYISEWSKTTAFNSQVSFFHGSYVSCFNFDGIASNDAYIYLNDTAEFTVATQTEIDRQIDDGNLLTGKVKRCIDSGLGYFIGEGNTW